MAAPKLPRSSRPSDAPKGPKLSGHFTAPTRVSVPVPAQREDSGTSSTRLRAQRPAEPAPRFEHATPSPYHVRPEQHTAVDRFESVAPPVTRTRSYPPELERLHKELTRRELASRTQTHFEVLGVSIDDDATAVSAAFEMLATRFDPTRLPEERASLRPQAQKPFLRVGRAYDTLRNPEARAVYEHTLEHGPLSRSIPSPAAALDAESHYRDAELALRRNDYPSALAFAQKALRSRTCARHEALYAWTLHLSSAPPSGKLHPRAVEHIDSALRRDARCIEALQYKALMHKHAGEADAAHACWKRLLREKPDHIDAAREVRLWAMRTKQRTSTSGFLERILGRKPDGR